MNKTVISVAALIAALLMLCTVACGKNDSDASSQTAEPAQTAEASQTASTIDSSSATTADFTAESTTDPAAAQTEKADISAPVLVGDLPKDAEVIETHTDENSYVQTLLYDSVAAITTGRFTSEGALTVFMNEKGWTYDVEESTFTNDSGLTGFRSIWSVGDNEDTRACEAFYFMEGDYYYLFLCSMPADYYYGYSDMGPDAESVNIWINSLSVFVS